MFLVALVSEKVARQFGAGGDFYDSFGLLFGRSNGSENKCVLLCE